MDPFWRSDVLIHDGKIQVHATFQPIFVKRGNGRKFFINLSDAFMRRNILCPAI